MAEHERTTVLYSIQRTYILNGVSKHGKESITCDQRIDIPTIEPLVTATGETEEPVAINPCIELAGDFLSMCNLTFETNEGVTVLPIRIDRRQTPYSKDRYVLVLPRGATGVKSCKITHKIAGFEIPHDFTFGIIPPPYDYDNALFGIIPSRISSLENAVTNLEHRVRELENKAGG
jgi:hypothetical protein